MSNDNLPVNGYTIKELLNKYIEDDSLFKVELKEDLKGIKEFIHKQDLINYDLFNFKKTIEKEKEEKKKEEKDDKNKMKWYKRDYIKIILTSFLTGIAIKILGIFVK